MLRSFFAACAAVAALGVMPAAEKPRIFLTESGVTEVTADNFVVRKGTSPENIEVMKSFQKLCPGLTITANREKADFIVRFDRESPSPITPFVKGNKVAVFDRNEDLVFSESARYLSGAVKSTCSALLRKAEETRSR
jgi:hypothetical protein